MERTAMQCRFLIRHGSWIHQLTVTPLPLQSQDRQNYRCVLGAAPESPPLGEDVLAINGWWVKKNNFSLRMWLLVGCPGPTEWPMPMYIWPVLIRLGIMMMMMMFMIRDMKLGERWIVRGTLVEGSKVWLLWKYTLCMYDLYKGLIKYIKKFKN